MENLGGEFSMGSAINFRKEKRNMDDKIKKFVKKNNKVRKNIYDNNLNNTIRNEFHKRAKERFEASKNPQKTKIIPHIRVAKKKTKVELSDSDFSDENSKIEKRNMSEHSETPSTFFIDKSEKFIDNRKHEREFVKKTRDNDNYLNQFEPLRFDSSNNPVSQNAVHSGGSMVQRMEQERELGLRGEFSNFEETNDMTYGITEPDDFVHNNMKPNFKAKSAGNLLHAEHAGNVFQQRMEEFSGTLNKNRPDWQHKKEHAPLFNPANNIANVFGTPVMTDYYEGRYIPGKERRNEKPFQEIKVTPGIGLGANGVGHFTKGTGDLYRVMPRNIDDIRTVNKRRVVYNGVIIPGQKGSRGGTIGKQTSNRQFVKYREYAPDEMQKTYTGQVHAPQIIGEVDPFTLGGVDRGLKETNFVGPLKTEVGKATPGGLYGEYREPFKQNFLQAEPRNVQLVEGLRAQANYNTYVPNVTQREVKESYIGPVGRSEIAKPYAFDILGSVPNVPTKEIHAKTERSGKAITGDIQQGLYFNPNDITDPTMRNLYEKTERSGKAITGDLQQGQYFNPNDITDPTFRNLYEKTDRAGTAIAGDKFKGTVYNSNDITDPTLRNLYEKTDRAGTAIIGDKFKGTVYNPNDTMDPTSRDLYGKIDRAGSAIIGDKQPFVYYDPKDMPDATLRDVHSKTDRSGKAMTGNKYNGKTINFRDIPDQTLREIIGKTDYKGPAEHIVTKKPMSRRDAYNSKINVTREEIEKGRAPTLISYNKGPTTKFTEYPLKEPIQSIYINHPGMLYQTVDKLAFLAESHKNPTWYNNIHINTYPDVSLKKNPYINNMVHKAVINYDNVK